MRFLPDRVVVGETRLKSRAPKPPCRRPQRTPKPLLTARRPNLFKVGGGRGTGIKPSPLRPWAELHLAARLAIDLDHPDEKAFLQNLSQSLRLPDGLVRHLDAQVAQDFET